MGKIKVYENPRNNYREKVKEGFNWWVLLFGPLWYLFNGMAGKGIGWLLVAILAGAFTLGIGAIVVWIVAGAKANADKEKKYLEQGWKFVGYEDEINSIQKQNMN
ncbi:hypothetical protein MTAT_04370 [Moorella thermoacetica]|uniref:DUF2628 domain-containing protein n=1 Tax=Neomoorella thermoacetica TaxID=1525 RepID=A0AAC9MVH0_NEOTH|nr:DUF2628 domain-containing protein [Moorella thermoacetica]AOQ24764.1 hypothetical protein Maut_02336 [Moorella thermoacetica]TYL15698.1 hypothetical protein MTAT_04370 [Moorella thermoacetica]